MNVTVITGGGSGIGLEVAKLIKNGKVIITGRTVSKIKNAQDELIKNKIDVEIFCCDVSKRDDVIKLKNFALSFGEIKTVIHSAGLSPHMGDAKRLIEVNSLGTIYVDTEFEKAMGAGGCIINVSSNSAYQIPKFLIN